jgi:tetraacyldisaccharide-1-P 4'-kinase
MSLGSILSQKTYADHHRFSKEELKQMNSVALNMFEDQAFLTTHKDFVRFQDHFQEFPQLRNKLYYLPMEMFFLDGEQGFWAWLGAKLGR